MEELIKIGTSTITGLPVVNARNLHKFLDVGQNFSDWIKDKLEKWSFIENQDYARLYYDKFGKKLKINNEEKSGINNVIYKIEYILTLDCAKEISMAQNNSKGKKARLYFIAVEKEWKNLKLKSNNSKIMNEIKNLEVEKQVISSREIAIVTNKNHKHVLEDIREMCIQGEIKITIAENTAIVDSQEVMVIESEYEIEIGQGAKRKYKEYLLNDMAAQVLALGYDVKRRIAILKLVKEMKVALEKQVVRLQPPEPILVLSNGTHTIAEVAKLLNENKIGRDNISSHKINQVLRENKYFRPNNQPYQKWVNQGLFLIEQYDPKYYSAKRITVTDTKGLPIIQQLFNQNNSVSPISIKYSNQTFLLEKIENGRLTRLEEIMIAFINHMFACLNNKGKPIEIENYRSQLKIFKSEIEKEKIKNH